MTINKYNNDNFCLCIYYFRYNKEDESENKLEVAKCKPPIITNKRLIARQLVSILEAYSGSTQKMCLWL